MHIGKSVAVIASILSLAGIVGLLALIGQGGCNKNDEEVIFPGTTSKTENSTTRTAIPTFKPTTLPAAADPTAMDFKGPVTADNISAKIIQTLVGFNHPQAVAISLDGKFLYVTNSAATGPTGMLLGAGSISKLAIGADGQIGRASCRERV